MMAVHLILPLHLPNSTQLNQSMGLKQGNESRKAIFLPFCPRTNDILGWKFWDVLLCCYNCHYDFRVLRITGKYTSRHLCSSTE